MSEKSVKVVPKLVYWLSYPLVFPIGGFILFAVVGGVVAEILGFELIKPVILTGFVTTSLLTCWGIFKDFQRMFFELDTHFLTVGRGPKQVRVAIDEIEAVMLGLPNDVPWWMKTRVLRETVNTMRTHSLVLRLKGNRVLPLVNGIRLLKNGEEFLNALLRENQQKVRGSDSYTVAETKSLRVPRWNVILKVEKETITKTYA